MHPIPCAHCGLNFMRKTPDPEAHKLCNNCSLREEKRNPKSKNEEKMTTVNVTITCPAKDYVAIEEHCINEGIDFSRYFLELHYGSQAAIEVMKETQGKGDIPLEEEPTNFIKTDRVPFEGKKKVKSKK